VSALARMREALGAGDTDTALRIALAVWQETKSPAIGEVIDWLDSKYSYERPAGLSLAFQKKWLEAARGDDSPGIVGWLARTLGDRIPKPEGAPKEADANLVARLSALLAKPPDPRIGTAAINLFARTRAGTRGTYKRCAELVEKSTDRRHLEPMQRLENSHNYYNAGVFAARPIILRTMKGLEALPSADDREEWRSLIPVMPHETASGRATIDKLLEEVYSDPFNDELRAVCGDRLQELGDPRGEFIALQRLAKPSSEAKARIRDLLREHQETWLGRDLSAVFRTVKFRGGFPVHATLVSAWMAKEPVWQRALTDRRLATFEVVHLGKSQKWRRQAFLDAIAALQQDEEE